MSLFATKKKSDELDSATDNKCYIYPIQYINFLRKTEAQFEPFGSQWCHDNQKNDIITDIIKQRQKKLDKIKSYPQSKVKQKSEEWLELRKDKISASDCGTIIGVDSHNDQYNFLFKKLGKIPFESNENCYHGNKYEEIANMIYSYRMNVQVEEIGFVEHYDKEKCHFLGISPDGIIGKYKLDGKSLSKYVGRMIEIKCPTKRRIQLGGEIEGHIVPHEYYAQVQLQLECCDLNECDFWQCKLEEYDSLEDFITDTDPDEPFRSKKTGFEKGCLIQYFLISDLIHKKDYSEFVYKYSKFIHPPKIEMTPQDCDKWIHEQMANFNSEYCFDSIKYWRLSRSKCVTLNRDKKWFDDQYPKLKTMWNYIEFLRDHKNIEKILCDYIEYLPEKNNDEIMELIKYLCNYSDNDKKYKSKLVQLEKDTKNNKQKYENKLNKITDL